MGGSSPFATLARQGLKGPNGKRLDLALAKISHAIRHFVGMEGASNLCLPLWSLPWVWFIQLVLLP